MKLTKSLRFCRSIRRVIENLESRCLLSAAVISQIPAQTIQLVGAATTVSLDTYFDDSSVTAGDQLVAIQTNLPAPNNVIPLELTSSATPRTVANFLSYITNGEYANTIIHRSVPGFVIQGGGYDTDGTQIASLGQIPGEYTTETLKNTAGTIAMALSTGPNSATSEWFFNLGTNSELDTGDGGPFTVFGQVFDNGLSVLNTIASEPIVNDSSNGAWNTLPVQNYNGANGATVSSVPEADFITVNPMQVSSPLTYTVSSANSSIATGVVAGQTLSVTSVADGTTQLTVTATDLSGGTTTSTFSVTVGGSNSSTPTVSISNSTGHLGSGGPLLFPVTLSTASSTDTTLTYSLTAGTAPASDYQSTASMLTIPAGSTEANIPVTILADSTGTEETFTLTLADLSSNAVFSGGSGTLTATGIIEPAAAPTMQPTVTTLSVSSSSIAFGGSETLTANIAPQVAGTVVTGTVNFSVGGTAVASATVSNNMASVTVDIDSAGNQAVTAVYSGDASNVASTSNAVTVTVGNASQVTPFVDSSRLPASGIAGQPFRGSVAISLVNGNLLATQKGVLHLNLYATQDGTLTSDAVLIASSSRNLAIRPGATVNVPLPTTTLPVLLAAGNYTLVVQAVDSSGLLSHPEVGTTVSVTAPVVTLNTSFARLVLPASVVGGAKTGAVAVINIANSGNVASSGITGISLYASTDGTTADGTLIKTVSRRLVIQPGRSVNVSVPVGAYPSVAAGNYQIVAQVVDPLAQAFDAASTSTVLISPAFTDLADANLTAPASAHPGKAIVATLLLSNEGNVVAAGRLQISFEASTASDGSNPVSLTTLTVPIRLLPGKSQVLHLRVLIPAGTAVGTDYLVADIDPSDTFIESSLSNNIAVGSSPIVIS